MDQDNQVESADSLLLLDPDTERFFKAETGIQDAEELREHIIQVQQDAYKASCYLPTDDVLSRGAVLNVLFLCLALSVSLHSWVQIYEAQDRSDARVSTRLPAVEETTRRDISGHWVLPCEFRSPSVCFLCKMTDVRIVGTDLRKIVYDGWPISQTIASDLEAGMELG